jgi:hypothetical protein
MPDYVFPEVSFPRTPIASLACWDGESSIRRSRRNTEKIEWLPADKRGDGSSEVSPGIRGFPLAWSTDDHLPPVERSFLPRARFAGTFSVFICP